jgi:hypothetical protein
MGYTMTDEQAAALTAWKKLYGRGWKAKLQKAWETGNYSRFPEAGALQQLRNQAGPAWLAKAKVEGVETGMRTLIEAAEAARPRAPNKNAIAKVVAGVVGADKQVVPEITGGGWRMGIELVPAPGLFPKEAQTISDMQALGLSGAYYQWQKRAERLTAKIMKALPELSGGYRWHEVNGYISIVHGAGDETRRLVALNID